MYIAVREKDCDAKYFYNLDNAIDYIWRPAFTWAVSAEKTVEEVGVLYAKLLSELTLDVEDCGMYAGWIEEIKVEDEEE